MQNRETAEKPPSADAQPEKHEHHFTPYGLPVNCPMQFLAIDRDGGPAHTLIDMFGRLFESRVSYLLATTHDEALYIPNCAELSLIMLGLEPHTLDILALMPQLRAEHPNLPILAIGQHLTPINLALCEHFGVTDVIELPRRAAELKALVNKLTACYLR